MNEQAYNKKSSFNEERLEGYVKSFSFPRLAGTEGEEKAVGLTIDTFKDLGYTEEHIETENFNFSEFYSTTLIKMIMLLSINAVLILVLLTYLYWFVSVFVVLGMMVIILLIIRGLKHPEEAGFWGEYFGDTLNATNVIAKIPAKSLSYEQAGDIVISAHLDSKSQTLKTAWRIVLYRVALFSGILLGGFYIANIIYQSTFGIIDFPKIEVAGILIIDIGTWVLTILISVSFIFLMFLNTHNKSPGALDNASGMAIVFELSSYFIDHPLDNFNLWFCQFSAEELGTMGSRIFVNKYEDKFIKGRIFQINFDMVSSAQHAPKKNRVEYLKSYGVYPRKKIAPLLSKYLDKSAAEEGIEIFGFHLTTGAHLDSVPFHLRGFDAVDLSTRAAAKFTHNRVDTPDKVDPHVLWEACIIAKKVIDKLDGDYEMLCKTDQFYCDD